MKGPLMLVCCLAYATANPVAFFESNNQLDELIRQTFEYARFVLKTLDPFKLPNLPPLELKDDEVDVKFTLKDVGITDASDFSIDKIENNLPEFWANFQVTEPAARAEGSYQVKGTVFGKEVSGSGTFSVTIKQFMQKGHIQFNIVDHSLQVEQLDLDYDIDDVKIEETGLTIEGMTPEQVEEVLNVKFLKYMKDNKDYVSKKTAVHAMEVANKLLHGKSLREVLDFLRTVVASTPIPPPFPPM